MIEFNYITVNDALRLKHHNLSGHWTSMGWDDKIATVTYMLEATGEDVTVTVDINGVVTAPDELIFEMNEIDRYNDWPAENVMQDSGTSIPEGKTLSEILVEKNVHLDCK